MAALNCYLFRQIWGGGQRFRYILCYRNSLFRNFIDWPSRCRFSLLWVGIFGFLWFVFATASLSVHDPIVGGGPLRGSLLPASIAGSLFVFVLSGSKYIENINALLYIGRNTLPIFCLHVLFVAGTRIVLAKLFGISEMAYPVDSGSSICGDFAEFRRGIFGRPTSCAGVNHSRSNPLDQRNKLLFLQKFRRCIAPSIFAFAFRRRALALQAGDFSKHNI